MAPNRRTHGKIFAGMALLIIVVACIATAGCTGSSPTPPGTVVGLTEVPWSLETYLAENGTLVPVLPGTEVSAWFGDDGRVVGLAGCNRYSADYRLDGTTLTVSPPVSTRMYCAEPEGIMEQEARFLALLGSAAGCQVEEDHLVITDASGATVLTFGAGTPEDLAGTSWTLVEFVGEAGDRDPVLAGTEITLRFGDDGTLGGSAGCNDYGGNYTLEGTNLTPGSLVRTEMYCTDPPGVMEQEDRYLALLANVSTYQVDEGDRLVLADQKGADLLVFDRVAEAPALPLVGTEWVLEGYSLEGDAISSVIAGTTITAEFSPDGKIAGSAGCNRYGGQYLLDGANLSISSLFSTLMYCAEPEGTMEQEARFMDLLANVSSYQVEGDRLVLLDEAGTGLLFFVQAEEVPPVPLVGTEWALEAYTLEGDAISSVIAGTTITAEFSPDGKIAGSAGCNRYFASYEVAGTAMTIGPAGSTKIYCGEPEGTMEQEARFMDLLANVSSYQIEGDRLVLLDEAGTGLLFFVQAEEVPPVPLVGTEWVLEGYSLEGDAISSVIAGTTITAEFSPDGKITGSAGCNRYGGQYLLDGTNLSISSLFSTLMYCAEPEGTMEQEARFMDLLANVSSYQIEGDRLVLLDEAGTGLLFFVQAEEVPPVPLVGTEWTLVSYSLGDAISSVIAGTTITAEFSPDGKIAGSAGCNRYFASYEVAGTAMTIGPAGSTKIYCGEPEGIMEQEGRYLTLLESVAGYQIDGDRLDLLDEAGDTLLSYQASGTDQV
ncbi:MAG: META domain-containing protein [Candidatus Methanoculleus thermohydrogenotrophicum]